MDPIADSSSRFEKSLGLLTTKFVALLQEADHGILDLKAVSSTRGRNPMPGVPDAITPISCFVFRPRNC